LRVQENSTLSSCPDYLQFHIQENDYFGTLATVLDLLGQDLRRRGNIRHAETLVRLRNDIIYLLRRYRIEKQDEN